MKKRILCGEGTRIAMYTRKREKWLVLGEEMGFTKSIIIPIARFSNFRLSPHCSASLDSTFRSGHRTGRRIEASRTY